MYISKPSAGGGQAVCLGQWVQVQWETLNQNTRCVTSRKDSQHHLDAHARECIHAPHRDIHNTARTPGSIYLWSEGTEPLSVVFVALRQQSPGDCIWSFRSVTMSRNGVWSPTGTSPKITHNLRPHAWHQPPPLTSPRQQSWLLSTESLELGGPPPPFHPMADTGSCLNGILIFILLYKYI